MKLYTAKIEIEMMVVAEDEQDAARLAARYVRHEHPDPRDVLVSESKKPADGWDLDCVPAGGQRTVREWLNRQTKETGNE